MSTLVTFDEVIIERPELAEPVVAEIVDRLGRARGEAGFVAARVHLSLDRDRVIVRAEWPAEADGAERGILAHLPSREHLRAGSRFVGRTVPGLTGPQAGEMPGIVAVATRHLRDRAALDRLMALLAQSGGWKSHHPGFIEAVPHLGADGRTFINYPMWTDEGSYRAWMADPRIAEGQGEIARLEIAPPTYVLCAVSAHLTDSDS